jgi:hypothetical protein
VDDQYEHLSISDHEKNVLRVLDLYMMCPGAQLTKVTFMDRIWWAICRAYRKLTRRSVTRTEA